MDNHSQTVTDPSSRVIRDNFSMPGSDHRLIGTIQDRLLKEHALAKNKSEILRAGLRVLSNMDPDEMLIAIQAVEQLKPGRKPSR